jgi:hypothetical protein
VGRGQPETITANGRKLNEYGRLRADLPVTPRRIVVNSLAFDTALYKTTACLFNQQVPP